MIISLPQCGQHAVFGGEIDFETAENLSGDYVIRVPATAAVIGGMAGVMHGKSV